MSSLKMSFVMTISAALLQMISAAGCSKKETPQKEPHQPRPAPSRVEQEPDARAFAADTSKSRVSRGSDASPADPGISAGTVEGLSEAIPVVEPGKPLDRPQYNLTLTGPKRIMPNTKNEFELTLTPKGAFKTNKLFPFELELKPPPEGARFSKLKYVKKDASVFTPTKVTYKIAVEVTKEGPKRFDGTYKFSVCTPKFCELPKARLVWSINAGKPGKPHARKRSPGKQ